MKDERTEITQNRFCQSETQLSIAIAAPSPVPFVVGGAEKLWWGLQEYINRNTAHHCELIKVCTPEETFCGLMESYDRFRRLDLSHFDLVVTTKYPAWVLQHENHRIYYQHPLRGLYELYRGPGSLSPGAAAHPAVRKVFGALEEKHPSIRRITGRCLDLAHDSSAPDEALALPGPLARRAVRVLDRLALERASRVSAISRTVRDRPGYFLDPASVPVIHHPSNLSGFRDGGQEFLLTASRLVRSKRIHLIIAAYREAALDIPLFIAGRGPELGELRRQAGGHPGIRFTGFVSDRDLVDLYARSLAVVFVPENEDLGLITLEAMHSGKPVITATDAGGAAELLEHGHEGWICSPDVPSLASAMTEAAADRRRTAAMGEAAREKSAGITWESMAASLLGRGFAGSRKPPKNKPSSSPRRSLAVLGTFPVYPPRGGGQFRIYNLYRALTPDFDVRMVNLAAPGAGSCSSLVAPGLRETRIAASQGFAEKARELEKTLGIPAVDLATALWPELLPEMGAAAAAEAEKCDLVVFSHPYTCPLVPAVAGKKGIYEAHNVEYDIKRPFLEGVPGGPQALSRLFDVEKSACRETLHTLVCSDSDSLRLSELYGLDPARALLVPNGVDTEACPFTDPDDRPARRRALGIGPGLLALFLGSYHPPNIKAVGHISEMAREVPAVRFVVVGSVAKYFRYRPIPDNLGFAGEVGEAEKALWLACSDVALNPVTTGSGTNLKMFEYIAAGLPVLSTPFGARGLDISDMPVLLYELEHFAEALAAMDGSEGAAGETAGDALPKRVRSGRKRIEKHYRWEVIGRNLSARLQKIVAG